jgi:hypothetical protein
MSLLGFEDEKESPLLKKLLSALLKVVNSGTSTDLNKWPLSRFFGTELVLFNSVFLS